MKESSRNISIFVSADAEADKRRKGFIDRRRTDEVFTRRKTSESSLYFKFFDLGMLASGADIDFVQSATIQSLVDEVPPQLTLDENDYTANLNNYFLSQNLEVWRDSYAEITPDRPEFTDYPDISWREYSAEKGYKLSDIEIAESVIGYANYYAYKTTSLPSFDAPEVSFQITKDCEVYEVPEIHLWEGRNGFYPTAPTEQNPLSYFFQVFNLLLKPESRVFRRTQAYKDFVQAFLVYEDSSMNRWLLPSWSNPNFQQVFYNLFLSIPNARVFQYRMDWYLGDYTWQFEGMVSPGSFKYQREADWSFDNRAQVYAIQPPWVNYPWMALRPWHKKAGLLVSVIKHGEDWYYVWRKDTIYAHLNLHGPFFTMPREAYKKFGGVIDRP